MEFLINYTESVWRVIVSAAADTRCIFSLPTGVVLNLINHTRCSINSLNVCKKKRKKKKKKLLSMKKRQQSTSRAFRGSSLRARSRLRNWDAADLDSYLFLFFFFFSTDACCCTHLLRASGNAIPFRFNVSMSKNLIFGRLAWKVRVIFLQVENLQNKWINWLALKIKIFLKFPLQKESLY